MSEKLTQEKARKIIAENVTEKHLFTHALAVSAAMSAMAEYFGEDKEYWGAIGYLHDVDYEKFPNEHLQHTEEILAPLGIDEKDIHAIMTHGYGLCTELKPESNLEKSLFTVDELTGIIQACSLMRPTGITDLEVKSALKKFKDKSFAAKCNRAVILQGCEMLNMELPAVLELVINGMKTEAADLGLLPKQQ